jgi:hypothetical protein
MVLDLRWTWRKYVLPIFEGSSSRIFFQARLEKRHSKFVKKGISNRLRGVEKEGR